MINLPVGADGRQFGRAVEYCMLVCRSGGYSYFLEIIVVSHRELVVVESARIYGRYSVLWICCISAVFIRKDQIVFPGDHSL